MTLQACILYVLGPFGYVTPGCYYESTVSATPDYVYHVDRIDANGLYLAPEIYTSRWSSSTYRSRENFRRRNRLIRRGNRGLYRSRRYAPSRRVNRVRSERRYRRSLRKAKRRLARAEKRRYSRRTKRASTRSKMRRQRTNARTSGRSRVRNQNRRR